MLADPGFASGLRPIPHGSLDPSAPRTAADLAGTTPAGQPIEIGIGATACRRVLLAFLHTRCDGCDQFWSGFRSPDEIGLPVDVAAIVITKGTSSVRAAEVAASAAGVDGVPVVMSDGAWSDYRVLGYPFFVLVDVASRTVVGETVGFGWDDVLAMTRAET